MASHRYQTLGFSVQGSNDITKKSRGYLVNHGGRRQVIKIPENSFDLKVEHLEPCKPFSSLRKSNQFLKFDSMMKPRLLDVHETGQEEVVLKGRAVVMSLLSDLNQEPAILPLLQFSRLDSEVLIETLQPDEVNLDAVTLAPPQKTKATKPSRKKQNPKLRDRENDLYKRNHLHACESLVSLMIGSEQHRQTTLLSLKKSCGDLSELLTRLSIGFAGTGIAVFFFVVCNVASGRAPFCANKVFDAGLSLSLVLLSWAVSRLREAIVGINKKAIKGEENTNRVETRIKDVYFRAATVIIMVALRFR